jgi:hypothetical protein
MPTAWQPAAPAARCTSASRPSRGPHPLAAAAPILRKWRATTPCLQGPSSCRHGGRRRRRMQYQTRFVVVAAAAAQRPWRSTPPHPAAARARSPPAPWPAAVRHPTQRCVAIQSSTDRAAVSCVPLFWLHRVSASRQSVWYGLALLKTAAPLPQVPTSSRDASPPLRARRGFLGGLGFGSFFSRAKAPESPPKPPAVQQVCSGGITAEEVHIRGVGGAGCSEVQQIAAVVPCQRHPGTPGVSRSSCCCSNKRYSQCCYLAVVSGKYLHLDRMDVDL